MTFLMPFFALPQKNRTNRSADGGGKICEVRKLRHIHIVCRVRARVRVCDYETNEMGEQIIRNRPK